MEPYLQDADFTLWNGDALEVLRGLPDESVHCCVTSPPYWGLRDYGTGTWEGGNPECDHRPETARRRTERRASTLEGGVATITAQEQGAQARESCPRCGARRVDDQLGLEATPDLYVARMVEVFREIRRVLRSDGTCWVNLGDSYNSAASNQRNELIGGWDAGMGRSSTLAPDLKPKDLVGIPWRVAFALQADGWWLRSDIIWAKPNPMPESVTDRPTKAHEMVFLLAKGQWKTRVVQFADLPSETFHFSEYLWPGRATVGAATRHLVLLAAAIFDCAQREQEFGLPPLDAEIWKKRSDGSDSDLVGGLPVEHRSAVWAARFLCANATAKEFVHEVDRLTVTLSDRGDLLKRWCAAEVALTPGVDSDGKAAVAIHNAGEICEVDFGSHSVNLRRPVRCSYFYDADAIREGYSYDGRNVTAVQGRNGSLQHRNGERWPGMRPQQSRAVEIAQQAGLTEDHLDAIRACGTTDAGKAQITQTGYGKNVPDVQRLADEAKAALGGYYREFLTPMAGRNARSVWEIATQPYPEAHFAVFPEELARRCISAGCPEGGTVLDPFMGSGTTALVARKLGRKSVGIELNPDYCELAARRLGQQSLLAL